MKLKDTCSLEEKLWKPRQHVKKHRHHFADKGPSSQSYGFSSSQVWVWELDHKEGWALKNWYFRTVMLEKILEEFLGQQGDQISQYLRKPTLNIHWKDCAGVEASILWSPDVKNWLIGKDPDAGKGGERGWDGWIASETQWTWVWASSGSWCWTGRPGVL